MRSPASGKVAAERGAPPILGGGGCFYGYPKEMDYEGTDMSWMRPDKEFTVPDCATSNQKDFGRFTYDLYPKCLNTYQAYAYVNTGVLLPCCYVDGEEYEDDITMLTQEHLKLENNKSVFDICSYLFEQFSTFS